jgi:predicted transcriptional regulator
MKDSLHAAIDIVEAQASLRPMTEEEIVSLLVGLSASLEGSRGEPATGNPVAKPTSGIREKSVICLECGARYRVLSGKHLALHGMTADEYREKWGIKKGLALVAKELVRQRRKKMNEMKLWEKREVYRKIRGEFPS